MSRESLKIPIFPIFTPPEKDFRGLAHGIMTWKWADF
jgi:hypothetical protein